jgi:hypothetical protein
VSSPFAGLQKRQEPRWAPDPGFRLRHLAIVLLVAGGLFLEFAVAAVFVLDRSPTGSVQPARKSYPRSELKRLVIGKSQAEVLQLLGRPDHTFEHAGGVDWTYLGISYDPIAREEPSLARLNFQAGRVVSVDF